MKLSNTIKIAFKNITKNKTRSFLTSLGIIIGVCSVVIMVGIGEGTQKGIEEQISSLGTNLIIIFPGSRGHGGINQGAGSINRLTLDDVERIKKDGTYIEGISPIISSNEQIVGGGNNWRTSINGVSSDYQTIKDYVLSSGDFFTDQDTKVSKNVAVIGQTIADQLFPDDNPIDKKIIIGKIPFKVLGLIQSKGKSSGGFDQDDIILIPYSTMLNKISGSRFLRSIYISTTSPDVIDIQQEELRQILREQHKLKDSDPDDFTLGNQADIAERASSVTGMMTLLLGSIAAVSLIVGGIGIMNIMLVSVTERTREIGTRLAVGARKNDILMQFLIESFVLSIIGGIIGVIISFIVSFIFNNFTSINLVININIVAIAVVFSGTVGIFFGFYPANKASRLNPIDALRYE